MEVYQNPHSPASLGKDIWFEWPRWKYHTPPSYQQRRLAQISAAGSLQSICRVFPVYVCGELKFLDTIEGLPRRRHTPLKERVAPRCQANSCQFPLPNSPQTFPAHGLAQFSPLSSASYFPRQYVLRLVRCPLPSSSSAPHS
jgi:hypothetical protein